jgi:excisionase family DNA binding protein
MTTAERPRPVGLTRADLLTPDDLATLLTIPRGTALRWAATGYVPAHKMGRHWRYVRSEVEQWLLDDAARR